MKYTLRSKLISSYIIIVVIIVGIISLVANAYIEKEFQDYVINRQEKKTEEIIDLITNQYVINGQWDSVYLEGIGMDALENGLIINVSNIENETVWSATEHNNGLCEDMIINVRENMFNYYTDWKGDYEEKYFPIKVEGNKIGTLSTGYVGPYYFNDEELVFITALNRVFIIIGVASLVLAIIIGTLMALSISNPLKRVIKMLNLLKEGHYKQPIEQTTNITEIKLLINTINTLALRLEKQENLRKQLTQDVAHELRTPLTSVQGHMEAMIDGIWELDVKRLASCYDEVMRIKKLIASIENLSSIENANLVLNKKEFDLTNLIEQILQNFEKYFMRKKITVKFNKTVVKMIGDKDKLGQVFNNLISNSIKYSEDNSQITIKLNKKNKIIEIKVSDTGTGISELDIENIFERFYRGDKSRNKEIDGLGIGLTITRAIIEAHQGHIKVKSEVGVGTEFLIELPIR